MSRVPSTLHCIFLVLHLPWLSQPTCWSGSFHESVWKLSSDCDSSCSIHLLFAATVTREVRLSCPFEHMTRGWQPHDVAQFDLLYTRDHHCFFKVPVNFLLCGNCHWSWLLGNYSSGVCCQSGEQHCTFVSTHFQRNPTCASGSASVADLVTRCCPLPLAADDAVFMRRLSLGFGSGSIGFSLDSCDVGAAKCGADAAVVTLLLFSFLCSPLCNSSANASLITSRLRSNLFCSLLSYSGTFFNSYSARIWMGLRPFVVFDCVATWASNSCSELFGLASWFFPCGFVLLHMAMAGLGSNPLGFLVCLLPHLPSWRLLCPICSAVPIFWFDELWKHHLHSQWGILHCCSAYLTLPLNLQFSKQCN